MVFGHCVRDLFLRDIRHKVCACVGGEMAEERERDARMCVMVKIKNSNTRHTS